MLHTAAPIRSISTGLSLAKANWRTLAQSKHIGEEFVDAAGKTYDVMGGSKAYEHSVQQFSTTSENQLITFPLTSRELRKKQLLT